eukprot:CCRYP_002191-RA/>CCRYP_002191-RA protein AED:0.37 eAED:0.37 QI:0/-1/0/1/-1/0/1/0/47
MNAHSSASGHFFLSENEHYPTNNRAVRTIAQTIKAVGQTWCALHQRT